MLIDMPLIWLGASRDRRTGESRTVGILTRDPTMPNHGAKTRPLSTNTRASRALASLQCRSSEYAGAYNGLLWFGHAR